MDASNNLYVLQICLLKSPQLDKDTVQWQKRLPGKRKFLSSVPGTKKANKWIKTKIFNFNVINQTVRSLSTMTYLYTSFYLSQRVQQRIGYENTLLSTTITNICKNQLINRKQLLWLVVFGGPSGPHCFWISHICQSETTHCLAKTSKRQGERDTKKHIPHPNGQ